MSLRTFLQHLIPRLIIAGISAVPSIVALWLAEFRLKKVGRFEYYNIIVASIMALLIAFFGLYEYAYGAAGKDAQAGLIFIFLPIYVIIMGGISYLIGYFIRHTIRLPQKISHVATNLGTVTYRGVLFIPILLVVGYLIFAVIALKDEVYMSIAESSSTPVSELRFLFENAKEENNSGISLFLAQNRKSPPDILEGLSELPFGHVRVFVAKHPNTPTSVVEKMLSDDNECVRKFAQEEIIKRRGSK